MIIVGVDEVGRGCLVGNVVAGAVILPDDFYLPELTDSKKLSEKKREILYAQITEQCQWAVGESDANEIDSINILQGTMLAMKRAVENLNIKYDRVLVDGNRCPELHNCRAIIKGDLSEPVISAASIIAKVTRDRQMFELDKLHPKYGFSKHKGYGTRQHLEALAEFGAIDNQHRFSFSPIKNLRPPL
ncbi:ribonuclease HII [Bathymodiolus septemdierum thioautotrophic gill symbiont]|uniref:Ribonuclease HII n=1 Tax=endosymbiont of Bathymodiolus septemdierum str. Myojin knoll TaxID=1303921 RepID=A0A0P0UPW3_9GAMM|nr:ribonuclease HII [Bathymodiolus septemdierum thioautotrophic gill symbiont]BAS67101.1 ribonuclease HII [endosymbiont of Bathymodiolus septemdierum str. Myojin knoll]